MLMKPNRKIASSIVEKFLVRNSPESMKEGNEIFMEQKSEDQKVMTGMEVAADDMMKAFESKDKEKFVTALRAFIQMTLDDMDYTEDEEEKLEL